MTSNVDRSPNGAGISANDMRKFREAIRNFVDVPVQDQWTSTVNDRQTTTNLRLRERKPMRMDGRMICVSCMKAFGDNETVSACCELGFYGTAIQELNRDE